MATNIIINYYDGSSYVELYPKAYNATTADTLTTSRTIRTNLSSTSSVSFNGSSNITPGVQGTLPVAYGGTGVTSLSSLASNLNSYISVKTYSTASYYGTNTDRFEITVNFTSLGHIPVLVGHASGYLGVGAGKSNFSLSIGSGVSESPPYVTVTQSSCVISASNIYLNQGMYYQMLFM